MNKDHDAKTFRRKPGSNYSVCNICLELRITDKFGMLKLTEKSLIGLNHKETPTALHHCNS